ncbi:MAG TPA: DUF2231 domain-containing protein [Gemmatimonadales bacterium]|nr:DUF2231 domain-containing protein [Gemmatimonadales bacterium]
MPDIGQFHPQLVHFVVAFGLLGVAFRLISLIGRPAWVSPAASTLLILTGLIGVVTAFSGSRAHGPVERVPGVGEAVDEHEDAGEWTRDLFLLVAGIELAGLALARRERVAKGLRVASALAGIVAAGALYRAGDLGGHLVYSYAGGVGIRSGDPEDIHRLLVAGLYNESMAARQAGRSQEAQRLTDELVRQVPDDPEVQLLAIESLIQDRHQPDSALTALSALKAPDEGPGFTIRRGMLESEALATTGKKDSARAVLQGLIQRYPRAQRFLGPALAKLQ